MVLNPHLFEHLIGQFLPTFGRKCVYFSTVSTTNVLITHSEVKKWLLGAREFSLSSGLTLSLIEHYKTPDLVFNFKFKLVGRTL